VNFIEAYAHLFKVGAGFAMRPKKDYMLGRGFYINPFLSNTLYSLTTGLPVPAPNYEEACLTEWEVVAYAQIGTERSLAETIALSKEALTVK
jgi:hypothetical protein